MRRPSWPPCIINPRKFTRTPALRGGGRRHLWASAGSAARLVRRLAVPPGGDRRQARVPRVPRGSAATTPRSACRAAVVLSWCVLWAAPISRVCADPAPACNSSWAWGRRCAWGRGPRPSAFLVFLALPEWPLLAGVGAGVAPSGSTASISASVAGPAPPAWRCHSGDPRADFVVGECLGVGQPLLRLPLGTHRVRYIGDEYGRVWADEYRRVWDLWRQCPQLVV